MTPDTTTYGAAAQPSSTRRTSTPVRAGAAKRTGLSLHLHRSRARHRGASQWVAVAVLVGAIVAIAFVNFLAH